VSDTHQNQRERERLVAGSPREMSSERMMLLSFKTERLAELQDRKPREGREGGREGRREGGRESLTTFA